MELEPEMLATETIVPVYFAMEDDELLSIYTQTLTSSSSQGSLSAAEGRDLSPLVCIIHRNMIKKFYTDSRDSICGMGILHDIKIYETVSSNLMFSVIFL